MWSFDAGFSTGLPHDVWGTFIDHKVCSGVLVAILILTLMYIVGHRVLTQYSAVYVKLFDDQQLVVLHHTIEVVVLGILFAPMTYLILSLNFELLSLSNFKVKMQILIIFMISLIMMYAFELASRFRNPRSLLVVHHLAAYANTLLPIFFYDTANMKAATILTHMITFEVISFVGLVMYRLQPNNRATPHVIMAGIIVMGLSRPLQVLWIVSTFVISWDYLIVWQAVLQLCLTALFTTLQLYSINIQVTLWRKSKKRHKNMSIEEHPDTKDKPLTVLLNNNKDLFAVVDGVAYVNVAKVPTK